MKTWNDVEHVYYINLQSRPDRKQHVEEQLETVGLKQKATRFNAIKMDNGAIGCTMSHLKLLELAKEQRLDHILIVEDDILFTNPTLFVQQASLFLSKHSDFDVVLIAGNNCPPFTPIDESCVQVNRCQTTTGYLVMNHYYDTLIANYRSGLLKLLREPNNHKIYAIDKYWFQLQAIHKWYLIIPLTNTQREDYSDIEKRNTNYSSVMLDLDKVAFFKRQQELASLRKLYGVL
jgi:glycosyl transferase family 25